MKAHIGSDSAFTMGEMRWHSLDAMHVESIDSHTWCNLTCMQRNTMPINVIACVIACMAFNHWWSYVNLRTNLFLTLTCMRVCMPWANVHDIVVNVTGEKPSRATHAWECMPWETTCDRHSYTSKSLVANASERKSKRRISERSSEKLAFVCAGSSHATSSPSVKGCGHNRHISTFVQSAFYWRWHIDLHKLINDLESIHGKLHSASTNFLNRPRLRLGRFKKLVSALCNFPYKSSDKPETTGNESVGSFLNRRQRQITVKRYF